MNTPITYCYSDSYFVTCMSHQKLTVMKKNSIIGLLLFIFAFAGQSQKIYSVENLKQTSQEDLNTYLDKALKLKKDGKTVTIVGGSILGTTAIAVVTIGKQMDLGVVLLGFVGGLAGLGTMAVGISMNVTGKKRIERINTIKNTAYDGFKIDLKPCAQYNFVTQNYQPGITLRIKF